jgi:sulfonate transport system substrate-binding protein
VKYRFGSVGRNAATDSTLVNLGSAATSAIGALKAGRVDVVAFFQPIARQAEKPTTNRATAPRTRASLAPLVGRVRANEGVQLR